MTFSGLAAGTVAHHNKYQSRGGKKITRVIVHHWAGTVGGDTRLKDPSQKVSANYILYNDGRLVGQVPEEYRAWTSGSLTADAPSITIETQNQSTGGSWPVSDAAIDTLTRLIADIAKRYGWTKVTRANVCGHREFAATACPGEYLYSRLGKIAAAADKLLKNTSSTVNKPAASATKSIDQLADEVIAGKYGNGAARKKALGSQYDAVQARVNQILGIK